MATEEVSEVRVVITQDHIDYLAATARNLSQTSTLGRLMGEEELVSQSLLTLWEMARAFDPDLNVPFIAYLALYGRLRLIDYLRHSYGRFHDGEVAHRARAALGTLSLDTGADPDRNDEWAAALVDIAPSVEEVVEGRDEVHRLGVLFRSGELSPDETRSLLWPVEEGTAVPFIVESGINYNRAARLRMVAKAKAAAYLGRTVHLRIYTSRERWLLLGAKRRSRQADEVA